MARRKKIVSDESSFWAGFDDYKARQNYNIPLRDDHLSPMENPVAPVFEPEKSAVGVAIHIGKREYQQDAVITSCPRCQTLPSCFFAALCDGMGGMNGGEKASSLGVRLALESYKCKGDVDPYEFYINLAQEMDYQISSLENPDGTLMGAGSTFISVLIQENCLWLSSVGDSHIYLVRDGKIFLMAKEHNYYQDLLELVATNCITLEEANADPKKEALTSYMGMGGLERLEVNKFPYELLPNDVIVLCSDGLYRVVSDEEIARIVTQSGDNMQNAAKSLVECALSKNNPYQDNTSVILAKYN